MLIELPAAELLDKSPEERARYVLSACLKQPPPEDFIARNAEAIRQDDLGFLQRFLGQWPGAFRSTVGGSQRGAEAMKSLEEIISIRFLMAVPAEQFLEIAYREFFDRNLDDAGRGEFGGRDFNLPRHREAVIASLAGSTEFARLSGSRVLAGPTEMMRRMRKTGVQALYWDERPALSSEWYSQGPLPSVLSGQYMPFLLWLPERQHLYTLPGVHVMGEITENRLAAPPEWVFWGPKAPLPAGDYLVSVDIKGEPADLFLFDAVSEIGGTVHTSIKYFGSISLRVALKVDQLVEDFEIRLFNYTGRVAEVELNELSLARQ